MPLTVAELQAINTEENREPYVAGMGPGEPVDYWSYRPEPGKSWVCRDFTQAKAERLNERGYDRLNNTVGLCWTERVVPPSETYPEGREFHAVLMVYLDGLTWVLDSRFDAIYRLEDPPADYRWDRRQVPGTDDFVPMT